MYINFQPNDKDPKAKKGESKYGDCSVRAICKAEDLTWLEAYDLMYKYSREVQCPMNCKHGWEYILKKLGYEYHSLGRIQKGQKRPTIESFANEHPVGTFLPVIAGHDVCIKNGDWYDTFNSGYCSLYGYWEKKN